MSRWSLTAIDDDGLDDNRRALKEATKLGLPSGDSDGLNPGSRLHLCASEGVRGVAKLVSYALERGVRIALEPLHPMFVANRAVISTLGQTLDMAEPHPVKAVGVVIDTFHVWWDPDLEALIKTAGERGRISSHQVCDWWCRWKPTSSCPAG